MRRCQDQQHVIYQPAIINGAYKRVEQCRSFSTLLCKSNQALLDFKRSLRRFILPEVSQNRRNILFFVVILPSKWVIFCTLTINVLGLPMTDIRLGSGYGELNNHGRCFIIKTTRCHSANGLQSSLPAKWTNPQINPRQLQQPLLPR